MLLAAVAFGLWAPRRAATPAVQTETHASAAVVASPPPVLQARSGEMVLIPGGTALLGQNRTPKNVAAFYIDRTEVPVSSYVQFCHATGRALPTGMTDPNSNLPVTNVSFDDAQSFAKWAGERLPTADEWEKAARGSQGNLYPWGDQYKPGVANLQSANLEPVDCCPAGKSPYGALNMVGNAWEWVDTPADVPTGADFRAYRDNQFADLQPPLSPSESFYQIRGGSYTFILRKGTEPAALVWDYGTFPVRAKKPDVGFRCARDVTP